MSEIKKRGRGRPRKTEIEKAIKPGKVGRPKGVASVIKEYQARMLASPKSPLVLQKVFDIALDDAHPHQAACLKLVWDKLLPASYFEKDRMGNATPRIDININLDGDKASVSTEQPIEGEWEDA